MEASKLYTIQEVPDKGLGLIAAVTIERGTRILSEAPLLKIPSSIRSFKHLRRLLSENVASLTEEDRAQFYSLRNSRTDEKSRELGIARTNALPLGSEADASAIFPIASRINHACIQNAQNTWNEALQRLTIHAVRDIEKGEEITICYLRERVNRGARRRALQKSFSFSCTCQICFLPAPRRESSDKRLDEIQRIDQEIGSGMLMMLSPLKALHDVRRLLALCKEEGIADGTIPRAYYDAFQIAVFQGDAARGRAFANRAVASRIIQEGEDSPTVHQQKRLAEDPTQHPTYGFGSKWSTSADEVPTTLSEEDFEAWLWKDQTVRIHNTIAQQHDSLRDDRTFPSFAALPYENDIDLEYWESLDGFMYHPRKHWCFLAEITDIDTFLRLRLIVKDKAGHKVPVSFHTDGRGTELSPSGVREGYTVAFLYAEQHGFMDLTVGIRHENPKALKVSTPLPSLH